MEMRLSRYDVACDAALNGFIQITSGFLACYVCVFIWTEDGLRGLLTHISR